MLTRANKLIENAAVGTFPSIQTIKEPIVWRAAQQQRKGDAVSADQWRPLFASDDTLIVKQLYNKPNHFFEITKY